jgi:hypothetical protein
MKVEELYQTNYQKDILMSDITDSIKETAKDMYAAGVMAESVYKKLIEDIEKSSEQVLAHGATLDNSGCSGCPNRGSCKNAE